jgi:cell wall-associated NlpC family hydrolase
LDGALSQTRGCKQGGQQTMSLIGNAVVAVARDWGGTPYVHQASARGAGTDCLGLLRGEWREVLGREPEHVPAYSMD